MGAWNWAGGGKSWEEREEESESCGDRVIKGLSMVPQWREAKGVEALFAFKVTERTKEFDHVCGYK